MRCDGRVEVLRRGGSSGGGVTVEEQRLGVLIQHDSTTPAAAVLSVPVLRRSGIAHLRV